MARFTVSRKANRDLTDIWKYIAVDSVQHADRWLARIYQLFALLGTEPLLGVTSDHIHPGTRKFPIGNYIVYYRVKGKSVYILHVFHGRRNQRRAFEKQ